MNTTSETFLPDFLQDYESMFSFLSEQAIKIGKKSTTSKSKAKGDFFENLASEVIAEHPEIELPASKVRCEFTGGSWEDGIDLIFRDDNDDEILLYAQVKWSISKVDDIDLILSKFESYFRKGISGEGNLNVDEEQLALSLIEESFSNSSPQKQVEFAIITLKKNCDNILARYKQSKRSSKKFYEHLASEKSIHIIDGIQVFNLLRTNLSRLCGILPDVDLKLENDPIRMQNGN
jgi:hypothetical protein